MFEGNETLLEVCHYECYIGFSHQRNSAISLSLAQSFISWAIVIVIVMAWMIAILRFLFYWRILNLFSWGCSYSPPRNKKAFQSNANRLLADRCLGLIVNKFERVWMGCPCDLWWVASWVVVTWDPSSSVDRQTDTTEKIASTTSLREVKIHNGNCNINSSFVITKIRLANYLHSPFTIYSQKAITTYDTHKKNHLLNA